MEAIIQRLIQKRDLLMNGDDAHKKIRPLLIVCGGAMRGVYGAGSVAALHALGLADVFDTVIGISTGAGIAAYFLAGYEQTLLGTTIYYEDCSGTRFLKLRPRPTANVDYLETVFRNAKKLDTAAITQHRSQFFVGVSDWNTGIHSLLDAKHAQPDMVTALKASMAIMPLYRTPVEVNGHLYYDGAISRLLPLSFIDDFLPTDVLIISNRPENEWHEKGETALRKKAILRMLCFGLPHHVRTGVLRLSETQYEDVSAFKKLSVNTGVIFAPNVGVDVVTTNASILRNGAQCAAEETLRVFGRPDLKVNLI